MVLIQLVEKRLADRNYLIETPDRRKRVQLCHINLLNPYYSSHSPLMVAAKADDEGNSVHSVDCKPVLLTDVCFRPGRRGKGS